ncbi:PREDICTED: uncharacterized protein LOC108567611 [Nicrophorus vespilloides]|uniref:Gustatory receptor n=1 Tax=Nicrophorus vespilloides TaxID=110193 RepID=A0ABM1NA29_NICVS|nr:PREDICTED: uncharacterized protein LOC108567611 [Nicrophorus vespilloides]
MGTRLDLKSIKPLYILATVLSLVPLYNFGNKNVKNGKYLYAFLVISIFSFMPVLSLQERLFSTYPFTPNYTDILLDFGSYVCLTLANLINLIVLRLVHWKKLNTLIRKIQILDSKYFKQQDDISNKRFNVECSLYYGILIFGLSYNEIFWDLAYGFKSNWAYFFQNIQKLQLLTTSMLVHNIALTFKYRFECLNRNLSQTRINLYVKKDLLYPIANDMSKSVKVINEIHKSLLIMFRDFNTIFGVPVIFIMMVFVFGMLHPINSVLLQLIKGNIISGMDDPDFGKHYVAITSLIAISTFTFVIPFSFSCHGAVAEAKKVSLISRTVINDLPIYLYDESLKLLIDELKIIAEESPNKYPLFSARGFYPIDNTVLLILFGTVTTYLIVLIQLNMED